MRVLPACWLCLLVACNLEAERARRALESPDPVQRAEALEVLAEEGPSAGKLVAPLLRDSSARVRKKAVAALGVIGPRPFLTQLIDRLNDADLEVRLTTVRVLGDSELKAARAPLLLTLQDPSMVVRRAAAGALESLGLKPAEQVRGLAREQLDAQIKRLTVQDDQLRADAARMVGLSGRSRGLPPLFRLLSHRSPLVVQAAGRAIGRIGGEAALKRLERAARSGAEVQRQAAALGLAELGGPRAARELGRLLVQDRSTRVQRLALEGLLRAGSALDDRALARVCELLSHDELARKAARLVRRTGGDACAEQLQQLVQRARQGDASTLGPLSELAGDEVTAALQALARQAYERYRDQAIKWVAPDRWKELDRAKQAPASAPVGKGHKAALARLLARFPERSRDPVSDPLLPPELDVTQVARMIRTLAGRPGTDTWLAGVAGEAPLELRAAALEALGGTNRPCRGEVARAIELGLKAERPVIRRAALQACRRLSAPLDTAIKLLRDKDFDVRVAAARCLGELGQGRAVKPLLRALEREHSPAVIQALARLGDHSASAPISELLREDYAATRHDERVVVVRALGELGDPAVAPALERELSHPDWRVRLAAVRALERLGQPAARRALQLCRQDYYATVRQACERALREPGAASRPASRPASSEESRGAHE